MNVEKDFVWNERDGYAILEKYVKKYKSARDLKSGEEPEVKETRLVIPAEHDGKPVKEIFDAAFAMNGVVEELVLPDCVEKIGCMAFNQCGELKKLTFGNNIRRFGYFALNATAMMGEESNWRGPLFIQNGWLIACKDDVKEITIPSDVVGVADYAFYFARDLKKILLPDSVKYIGMRSFAFELYLDEVYIPRSVVEAHWQIFGANVNIKKLTIPQEIYDGQKIDPGVKIDEVVLI